MTFMFRRYMPKTNCRSRARILSSHGPVTGNLTGMSGIERGCLANTLTKRTRLRSRGLLREGILRHKPDNVAAMADHDVGIKRKPARHLYAELSPADCFPDHQGAGRTDIHELAGASIARPAASDKGPVPTSLTPLKNTTRAMRLLRLLPLSPG